MPPHLLSVEHCVQESSTGCLAACAQMVLRYIGINRSQRYLNQLLGLTSIGVPYPNIVRLTQLGVQVTMNMDGQLQLQQAFNDNQPVIAFLRTGDLPYWQSNTQHAVVIIGYDDTYCYINDPAFTIAPKKWNGTHFF